MLENLTFGAEHIILLMGGLLIISILAGALSSRVGAPLLLVFLVLGMLLGEEGPGGIEFDDFEAAYTIGSLALAMILFDGGFRTPMSALRLSWKPAGVLATVGVLITAVITGLCAYFVFDFGWFYAFTIGAVVASTDAAAVFLLLHQHGMELRRRVSSTLEVESGVNDPMAIFLTIVLVQVLTQERGVTLLESATIFITHMGLGGVIGVLGGMLLAWAINRLKLASGLYPVFVVAATLVIFGGTQSLHGSGWFAVYLAGIVAGNRRLRASKLIRRFHDGIAWICQIVMFVMLGLLVTPTRLLPDIGEAAVVAFALMFVARPVAVAVSLLPFRFSLREMIFIAWVGLRGAVPIFLAIIPVLGGVEGGLVFFNIAFLVVLASLVLQGWSIPWVARVLGIQVPSRPEAEGRLDIDLPQQLDRDVIGYRVATGSPAAGRLVTALEMPRRARILTVLRDNTVVPREKLLALEAGDVVLTICPPEETFRLDRQFEPRARNGRHREDVRLADFVFPAEITMGSVAQEYGLPVPARDLPLKLGEWMTARLGAGISVGDACRLGECALIVVDVAEHKVRQVGLRLEAGEEAEFGEGFFEHLRQLRHEADATLRRLRERLRVRRALPPPRRTIPAPDVDAAPGANPGADPREP
ncbi:MAG: potassium/proton antiporter [Dongiaceae bacterium]